MRRAFLGLAIGLQAVPQGREQVGHRLALHGVSLPAQRCCQLPHTHTGPAQGGLRVAAAGGLNQGLQRCHEGRIALRQRLAACTTATHPLAGCQCGSGLSRQFAQTEMQGAPRHPSRPCDEGLTAVAKRFGFGGSPQATGPFVHHWRQGDKFFSNDRFHDCLFHRSILGHFTKLYELFMDEP